MKFKELNIIEKEKLKEIGSSIFDEIETFDQKKVIYLTTDEKKARNHKLIGIGALFEIADLLNENLATLTGYCYSLHQKNNYYLNDCELMGKLYFLKKGVKK